MKQGFFLVELTVCIALFVLIASFTITVGSSFNTTSCVLELFLFKRAIQRAQFRAISTGIDQTLVISQKNNSYCFENETVMFKKIVIAKPSEKIFQPSSQIKVISRACTFLNDTIICFATGIISGGSLYWSSIDNKQLFFCLTCPVSQVNLINLYKYDTVWSMIS